MLLLLFEETLLKCLILLLSLLLIVEEDLYRLLQQILISYDLLHRVLQFYLSLSLLSLLSVTSLSYWSKCESTYL